MSKYLNSTCLDEVVHILDTDCLKDVQMSTMVSDFLYDHWFYKVKIKYLK